MHSSQFGITFTDSRGPVNSDGPIHCIRSLNRMVRYSVMPVCATPSSEAPTEMSKCRFHPIGAPTEWIEDYRLGGLHPIHLGNSLNGDRYKILRKLGYGS